MSYRPVIEVANLSTTSVLANSPLPLNTAVHGNSCALKHNGTGVTVTKAGYYFADANVTFTVPTAGNVTISIVKDGITVASATVTAAINTTYCVTIPKVLLSKCFTLPNNISLVTDTDITTTNATLDIFYLSDRK